MLFGKVILVTGVASGICRRTAELAARLPQRMNALCNVAGVSSAAGITATLGVNFYGLVE